MVGERGGGENGVGQFLVRLFSFIEVLSVLYCMQKKNKNVNFHFGVIFISLLPWCL